MTDLAAATHPSQRPLVMSIVPETAFRLKMASPLLPVVDVGFPRHCSIVPAIPPQIERRATWVEVSIHKSTIDIYRGF